ncbi:MAG: lysophospholipid acyltransferase family protein [Myxococcota bacterium]
MRIGHRLQRHPAFAALASFVLAWTLRLIGRSWRVRFEGNDPFATGEPFVGAMWHRNLLLAASTYRFRGVAVPVSRSRDGDLTTSALVRLGFAPPPRGSSSRGGSAALRGTLRYLRQGKVVGILTDGPKGPARRVKPGVLGLARSSGRPLLPIAMSARPCVRFSSWDRALLPLPFARVVVAYGEPMFVPKSTRGEGLEALRAGLERELDRLTDDLDRRLGLPPPSG